MDNGTLNKYWKEQPDAMVLPMGRDIANGLDYLHAEGIVHADLKSDNILVSPDGRPMLCGFGTSCVVLGSLIIDGSATLKESIRWMAAELIDPGPNAIPGAGGIHTQASDVWAFGMVLYELLSGKPPYHTLRTDASVVRAITNKISWYPVKPTDDECRDKDSTWLWDVCARCWARNPHERPTMSRLLDELRHTDILPPTIRTFSTTDLILSGVKVSGATADIHKAQIHLGATPVGSSVPHDRFEGKAVAVKRFRVFLSRNETIERARELRIWADLQHPNIYPLIGCVNLDTIPSPVSMWIDNGTLSQYWGAQVEAKVLPMAYDIANGLEYLHGMGVIHADLKSDNIFVSPDHRALICSFGNARIQTEDATIEGPTTLKGSVRWMAVELIEPDPNMQPSLRTKASDVWAYGMVLYELISGEIPYYHLHNDALVIRAITSEQNWYPLRPAEGEWRGGDSSWFWDICIRCWVRNPHERPSMSDLLEELQNRHEA